MTEGLLVTLRPASGIQVTPDEDAPYTLTIYPASKASCALLQI
jgi:hypothetical protein